MAKKPKNWAQFSPFLPIASLSDEFPGPVILADETQTVRWFVDKGESRGPREHVAHAQNEEGEFQHENPEPDVSGKPITEKSTITPAFWAMAAFV